MDAEGQEDRQVRPKRRWWQRAIRAAVLLCAVLGLAYATLPWWLPKRYVCDRFAEALSGRLGLPVSIARLDMSWREGIVLEDLRIGDDPAFGPDDMVRLGTVRCELSPLRLLLEGRLKWAEIEDARLHAVVSDSGQVNLAVLGRLSGGSPPERLMVRRAAVTIQLPRHDRLLELDVTDLQYGAGQLKHAGRITMSAGLAQRERAAPVSLVAFAGGGGEPGTAAACRFRFTGVDVAQLNLPLLLGLPLDRLAGEASGQLDTRLNVSGAVDQFALAVKIKDLDAQPRSGALTLPVVKEAQISLSASYDPLADPLGGTGKLDAESFRLRLPGVDVEGRATIQGAGWQGVQKLELDGKINPAQILALTGGKAATLPGGVEIDGDVKLSLRLKEKSRALTSTVTLDATEAAVRVGQRIIKPPARTLTAAFEGSLTKDLRDFSADALELRLGQNRFWGGGKARGVGAVLDRWLAARDLSTAAMFIDDLAALDWRGGWEITDLAALRDWNGPGLLDAVRLNGRLEGNWSIEHSGLALLRFWLRAPAEAELAVGDWFVKPPGKPLHLDASADVDTEAPRLHRLTAWAGVGEAGLSISDASLTFSLHPTGVPKAEPSAFGPPPDGQERPPTATARLWDLDTALGVRLEGRYNLHDAAGVLRCLPLAGAWAGRITGDVGGTFNVVHAPAFRRLHLEANGTLLNVSVGDLFDKAAGQPADIVADFTRDELLPAEDRNRLSVRAALGAQTLQAAVTFPPKDAELLPVRCQGRLVVADALWLLQRWPSLAQVLKDYDVRGSLLATLQAELTAGEVRGEVKVDADSLGFRLPALSGAKAAGAPLRLRVSGRYTGWGPQGQHPGPEVPRQAAIDLLAVDAGRTSLQGRGSVTFSGPKPKVQAAAVEVPKADASPLEAGRTGRYWPPVGVQAVELAIRGRLAHDAFLRALWPALARAGDRIGLDGSVRLDCALDGGSEALELSGSVDATDLVLAFEKVFRKPAGSAAQGRFTAAIPSDFSRLQVRDLFLDAGGLQLRADASVPLLGQGQFDSHLAVSAPDLRRLGDHVPALAPYAVEGALHADVELSRREGRDLVKYVAAKADNVIAVISGKPCRFDGSFTAEAIALDDNRQVASIGRIRTDALEFRLGDSHGFVRADVRNPLSGPAGQVDLLCEQLDVHDLQQWNSRPPAPVLATGGPGEPQAQELTRRAEAFIEAMRQYLLAANVVLRMQMDRLRYYDAEVKAIYEVGGLAAQIDAREGLLHAHYRCGLSGGDMEQDYTLNLNDPQPRLAVRGGTREIMSAESVLLQLAKEFPGNTFYGTLSRRNDLSYLFRDVVANSIDARAPLPMLGQSVVVTQDGIIRGRSAPRWITNIFPGLNLTTYRYSRMTSFTDYRPDGSAASDMIFSGPYDVYIEGVTDAGRIGSYEIGVILLGAPQSARFNHDFRTGRVPVLNFKAKIEGGQFLNEEVWPKYPTESAYTIFLKNNIFYRLWLSSRFLGHKPSITSEGGGQRDPSRPAENSNGDGSRLELRSPPASAPARLQPR